MVQALAKPVAGAKESVTRYEVLEQLGQLFLLRVEPFTGRAHQIRVQLASMGCPIRGDVKYGYPRPNADASINLHARRLFFSTQKPSSASTPVTFRPNAFTLRPS